MSATQCLDAVMAATSARQDEKKEKKENEEKEKKNAEPRKQTSKGGAKKRPAAASFSVEWSRKQVLCRTGKKGVGQSLSLSFDKCGGLEKAVAKAKKWVQEQNAAALKDNRINV